jgi:MFS family permease
VCLESGKSVTSDPDFVKFWVGQTIAVFGSQFSPLAVQVIAIDMLGVSNFQLGVLGFLNTVPFVLLGIFAGVWLDRHSRRKTLLAANLGRCMVLALIPLSYLLLSLNLNVIYVVTFAAGILIGPPAAARST